MNLIRNAGILLLIVLYIWLSKAIIVGAGGLTLKNIFLIVAAGIIIFVPIYKKYFRK